MVEPLKTLDKIGEFINKYTGSQYGYSEPEELGDNFNQIGEIFGFPVYVDDNRRYEREFLDMPSLGDLFQTIANTGISFDIHKGDCHICLIITFSIPLITYPPITICLAKADCKKEEEKIPQECIELNGHQVPEGLDTSRHTEWQEDLDRRPFCDPPDNPDYYLENLPPEEPGETVEVGIFWSRLHYYWGIYEYKAYGIVNRDIVFRFEPPIKHYMGSFFATTPLNIKEVNGTLYCNDRRVGETFTVSLSTQAGDLDNYPYDRSQTLIRTVSHITLSVISDNASPKPPKNPKPKPDPIPDPVINMDCCDELKALLKKMKTQIEEMHKVLDPLGFKKGDYQIPSNLIYPTNDSKPVKFDDIPDYLGAIARIVDRKIGYLPQLVHVKDADPAIEGDQEINLVVNSLADFNRLILEYMITAQGEIGATQKLAYSSMFEAGLAHQLGVSADAKLEAIAQFLDFECDEIKNEFPMSFDASVVPEENEKLEKYLSRILKPKMQPINLLNWKGGESLKDKVNDIIKKVSLAAAAVTETRDIDTVIEETKQLERLKRLLQIKETEDRLGVKDLKEFFDESEKAYPNSERTRGIIDKPYGFSPENKPKFKKTTKNKKTRYKRERPQNG